MADNSSDSGLYVFSKRDWDLSSDLTCVTLDMFSNVLPTPLVLITDDDGRQNIHIAPEAFDVAKSNYGDQIDVWQNALPGSLKGQLESVSRYVHNLPKHKFPHRHLKHSYQVPRFLQSMGRIHSSS